MAAKSEEKPRPDVVWTLIGDGLEPRPAPWGFVVRNPVALAVGPGTKREFRLGVASSVPLLAWARGDMAEYVTTDLFVPAGREIKIIIENKSQHSPIMVDDLEVILNIHPLVFRGTAGVG